MEVGVEHAERGLNFERRTVLLNSCTSANIHYTVLQRSQVWRTVSIALGLVNTLPVGCRGEAMPGTDSKRHSRDGDSTTDVLQCRVVESLRPQHAQRVHYLGRLFFLHGFCV